MPKILFHYKKITQTLQSINGRRATAPISSTHWGPKILPKKRNPGHWHGNLDWAWFFLNRHKTRTFCWCIFELQLPFSQISVILNLKGKRNFHYFENLTGSSGFTKNVLILRGRAQRSESEEGYLLIFGIQQRWIFLEIMQKSWNESVRWYHFRKWG